MVHILAIKGIFQTNEQFKEYEIHNFGLILTIFTVQLLFITKT